MNAGEHEKDLDKRQSSITYTDAAAKLIFSHLSHLIMQPEVDCSLTKLSFIIANHTAFN